MNFSSNYDVYKDFFYVKNETEKLSIPSLNSETEKLILTSAVVCAPLIASIVYGSQEVINNFNQQPDFYTKLVSFASDSLGISDKNTLLALAATAGTSIAIPLVCAIPALKKAIMDTAKSAADRTMKFVEKTIERYEDKSVYFEDSKELIDLMKKEYKNSDHLLPFKAKNTGVTYPLINSKHDKIRSDFTKSFDIVMDEQAVEQYCFLNLVSSVRQSRLENKELLCYSKLNLVKALNYADKTNFVWNKDDLKILSNHITDVVKELQTKLYITNPSDGIKKTLSANEEFSKNIVQSSEYFTVNCEIIKNIETSFNQIKKNQPFKKSFSDSLKSLVELRTEHYNNIAESINKLQMK